MLSSWGSPETRPTKKPARSRIASKTIDPSRAPGGIPGKRVAIVRNFLPLPDRRQWTVERKAEQPGVLSNHRGGNNVEHVVVGLLGYLVAMLLEHLPEIPLPRIGRHASQQVDDPVLAPVVGSHHQQARCLRVGG